MNDDYFTEEIKLRISPEDKKKIQKKMQQAEIRNMSAYIRKMAIDGIIVRLQISEITELLRLMRIYGNNVNQIAKAANSTKYVTQRELEEIKEYQKNIWNNLNSVLKKLSKITG